MSLLSNQRFAYGAKIVLCIIAVALPLLVLPAPFAGDVGRDIVLATLTIVAGVLWLISILGGGEIRYPVSPILWASGILVAIWGVSAFAGKAPFVSFFFGAASAERLVTLAAGIVLMILTAGILHSHRTGHADSTIRADAGTLLFTMVFAGAGAGLLSLYTFVAGPIGFLPVQPFFNAVGTINGMALFYAAIGMMAVGFLLSPASEQWKSWVRFAFAAAVVILLCDLALIHFRPAWMLMLGAGVCLFGLLLVDASHDRHALLSAHRFGWRQWAALGLVIFAIAMIMAPRPLVSFVEAPMEVSPSVNATFAIAGHIFREGPLRVFFGSGPAMFGLDWARYKDTAINQTVFWGVRFNQGQSWATTALPTTGILGFAGLLGFFSIMAFMFLRMILSSGRAGGGAGDALALGAFLGWVSLLVAAFLYPASTSLMLMFFFIAGVLTALLRRSPAASSAEDLVHEDGTFLSGDAAAPAHGVPTGGIWTIHERLLRFETPALVFASSLAIIFCMAFGIGALYGEGARVRAVLSADKGITAFNEGKVDEAIGLMEQATGAEPRNFAYVQLLTQMRIEKVRSLIQRAAGGENVQQDFQSAVSLAIQDSQRLTTMHPPEPLVWRIQGALYEAIIPFIQGSERFATSAYQRATELEPLNPAVYVDWGRAGLVFTDRIAVAANQLQGKDREDLEKARIQNLEQIATIFQHAIRAKQDFAPAHFLLAQTAMRLGNIDAAIQSVENAKLAAPFDIGVAFQLGLLYYQKGNMDRAQQEFERAISMNEQYANARYFLGLIHDRKKDPTRALEEFKRIAATNPDNQEVQRIIANLKAGKAALESIVPPAVPPQQRTDVPVRETERSR